MRVFSTKTSAIALTLVTGISAPSVAYACDNHGTVSNSGGYNSIVAANFTESSLGGGQQLAYSYAPAQPNPNVRYRPGTPCDHPSTNRRSKLHRSCKPPRNSSRTPRFSRVFSNRSNMPLRRVLFMLTAR